MKNKIIQSIKFLIFIAIGIVLLYFAFKGINFDHFWKAILEANYFWVLLALVCGWVAFWIRAYRWNLLLEPMGYKSDTNTNYHSVTIGYIANLAFPRLGELVRCGTLSKVKKIPVDKLVGTVLVERVFDLIMLALSLFFVLIIQYDFFGNFINENVFQPIAGPLVKKLGGSYLIWILILLFSVLSITIVYIFKEQLKKITLVKKVGKLAKGILEGLLSVVRMKRKAEFILLTLAIWIMYFFMGYLIFFALPSTSNLTVIDGIFILVIGSLGMSAPVQGGFGVFHAIVSLALMLFGISREDGLVYAVLAHESQTIMTILAGAISFFYLFVISKSKVKPEPNNN